MRQERDPGEAGGREGDSGQPPMPGWASEVLARELLSAADPASSGPEPVSTAPLSEAASRLAQQLRAGAASPLPAAIAGPGGMRGLLGKLFHRATRPATRRAEVLGAELALLQASIAERVERLEADVRVLRARIERSAREEGGRAQDAPPGAAPSDGGTDTPPGAAPSDGGTDTPPGGSASDPRNGR